MKWRPATLELAPLDDSELKACLGFLCADLEKRVERERLARMLRPVLSRRAQPFILGPFMATLLIDPCALDGSHRDRSRGRMVASSGRRRTQTKGSNAVMASLRQSRANWRRIVHGPMKTALPSRERRALDRWILVAGDFRLPTFELGVRLVGSSGIGVGKPILWMNTPADLFNWLLLRAAANFQVSRLAHCVVCGNWTLKKRANQRSAVKLGPLPSVDGSRRRAIEALPAWPALCGNSECKTLYHNVVSGRTSFRRGRFFGLTWNANPDHDRLKNHLRREA
jgi:hypothetical protein